MTEPGTGDILLSPGRSQGHRLTEPGTGNILLSPGRRTSPPRTQMTEPGSLCPGDFQLIKSISAIPLRCTPPSDRFRC